ncbi:exonuclease domain-containing protein [Candidatus Coxiella mudrowiae]|uniref:exonuclease domain-containing protein n=1 Tax=Candidatus Coxiella mudrowiae TaxID=2054173 RepID=UPI001FD1BE23|nr:exonuclease domain-containing protein [Candidatus Coxiella mudrowiae]
METTGLNKCFDQILQFAAIRTDESLNELERHEIRIRLNPDIIPSPTAIITNRISVAKMLSGKPEIEAIREIHQLMNNPGTISVGYNTLGFDDEFLRFSFYRNLLPPYTHQFNNQCGRLDLFPITILYYLYKSDVLNWPNPLNMKLENLSRMNQLAHGQAHDAMVDVNACISLAKKLMAHEEMWQYVIGYFDKKIETHRLAQLPAAIKSKFYHHREGILIQGNFGSTLAYQAPVIGLGPHKHYKNQYVWLRLDREELSTTTEKTIPKTTYTIRKVVGVQAIVLPALGRYLHHLSLKRFQLANENKQWLAAHPNIFQSICDYHQNFIYPNVPNLDPDAALYEIGFSTPYEEFLFQRFHLAVPEEKEKIVFEFPNPIRREQALRLIGRHYWDLLCKENQQKFSDYLKHAYDGEKNLSFDYRGRIRLTRNNALKEIAFLRKEKKLDAEQSILLDDLTDYLLKKIF